MFSVSPHNDQRLFLNFVWAAWVFLSCVVLRLLDGIRISQAFVEIGIYESVTSVDGAGMGSVQQR